MHSKLSIYPSDRMYYNIVIILDYYIHQSGFVIIILQCESIEMGTHIGEIPTEISILIGS